MMNSEKDNLIQDVSSDSNNNLRKYLLIGGGVFVLFVVGIVVSKFLFSTPKKSNTAVILPPEVNVKQKKADTALFNEIPVENENENGFKKPEIIPETENVDKKADTSIKKIEPQPIAMDKLENPVEREIKKPKIEKRVEKKEKIIPKKNSNTKLEKKYYIQVAATRGNPSKRFLNLLKKNKLEYKIIDVTVKGTKIKRILVGGYANYKDVKKALPDVKKKISSSAFIKVLK